MPSCILLKTYTALRSVSGKLGAETIVLAWTKAVSPDSRIVIPFCFTWSPFFKVFGNCFKSLADGLPALDCSAGFNHQYCGLRVDINQGVKVLCNYCVISFLYLDFYGMFFKFYFSYGYLVYPILYYCRKGREVHKHYMWRLSFVSGYFSDASSSAFRRL